MESPEIPLFLALDHANMTPHIDRFPFEKDGGIGSRLFYRWK
jgi:hypothetical protein